MNTEPEKQYIYIVKSELEKITCKIGATRNIEERLKDYNSTGKSITNFHQCLFAAEVSDMFQIEKDLKEEYPMLREKPDREMYFFNDGLFETYVKFFRDHPNFIKEIFIRVDPKKKEIKYVKKTTPTLKERELSRKDVMQKAKKIADDEFYTRYEDVEKEIKMYDKSV